MRSRLALVVMLLVSSLPSIGRAAGGDRPSTPSPAMPSSGEPSREALTPRQQAERWYGDAYDEIEKAKQEIRAGKAKNIEKRFRRAADRAMEATRLDSTYHEAWNLLGYASRKLGDLPKSLAAYRTSLRLSPDYAPAREYYGAALLESGDVAGAEKQLEWLRRLGAKELAAELDLAIAPHRVKTAEADSAR